MPKESPVAPYVTAVGGKFRVDVRHPGGGRYRRVMPHGTSSAEAAALAVEVRGMLGTMTTKAVRDEVRIRERGPRKKRGHSRPRTRDGIVYAVEAAGLGLVKIGFTRKADMKQRLSALSTGCPVALDIVHTVQATDRVERDLHTALAAFRVRARSEWFRLTREAARHALNCATFLAPSPESA